MDLRFRLLYQTCTDRVLKTKCHRKTIAQLAGDHTLRNLPVQRRRVEQCADTVFQFDLVNQCLLLLVFPLSPAISDSLYLQTARRMGRAYQDAAPFHTAAPDRIQPLRVRA